VSARGSVLTRGQTNEPRRSKCQGWLLALPRKVVVRVETAESIPCFTKRSIQRGCGLCAIRVRGDAGTSKMVTEQEEESPVFADGDSGRTSKVILGDLTAFFLVVSANKVDGFTANDGFYALSIAIGNELSIEALLHTTTLYISHIHSNLQIRILQKIASNNHYGKDRNRVKQSEKLDSEE